MKDTYYWSSESVPHFSHYDRKTPDQFTEEDDDGFTRSLVQNYATEGMAADGHPDGKFYLTLSTADQAAEEILRTHKGLTGAANKEFRTKNLQRAWDHVDLLNTGKVPVEEAHQLFRYMFDDIESAEGL